ncbi:RpiB/LacA/LacB family sugar-phosphate isomerase [Liquorilactobacillus capillatus]|uniref:Ribose-5-phosphate isomerase C-terminal domain-containing protein n=1 Tax=Liquorilactobacillus capillatus DSM 19910 TaxID=1423731 RepID=A0A0R1M6H2_9LACO|nr:RpiB/LacA/LacB family sugar-phosphate isomerase [Liquorilactobacillus capillatus]KRL01172.1 hypothetical protein FC81_GL001312 [Liquorilactobacillus capillatus DSM 19910]
MKIGFAIASTLLDKHDLLFQIIKRVSGKYGHTVIDLNNSEKETLDYIDVAILGGTALNKGKIDYFLTGCSSGLGMQIACNAIPNVICGYGTSSIEANLFSRINKGNAFSYPFALNWGWASEKKYENVLESLFKGFTQLPYPERDTTRKLSATEKLKRLKSISQLSFDEFTEKYN